MMDTGAEIGLDHLRTRADRGRRPLGELATEVQHDDAVACPHHRLHVVFDEENGRATVADFLDQAHNLKVVGSNPTPATNFVTFIGASLSSSGAFAFVAMAR